MKDQSFRSENTIFQSRCDMMMQEVLSFVQLDPTSTAHRLTLDDYSLLFFRVEELQLHAHARTLWSLLQTQQAQARLEWAAALAVPLPSASAGSEALIAAEAARAMPTLLQVPYKLVGLMIQSIVSAEGPQSAASLLFNEILPRTLPAPMITRQPAAAEFRPEAPPPFNPAGSAAASVTDLGAVSAPLLTFHPDPSSWIVEFERSIESGEAQRRQHSESPELAGACFESHASLFTPILRAFAHAHSRPSWPEGASPADSSGEGPSPAIRVTRTRALAEAMAFWDSLPSWGRNQVAYNIVLGALELAGLQQTASSRTSYNAFEVARGLFAEMQREHHSPWPDQELTLDSMALERLLTRLEARVSSKKYQRNGGLAPGGAELAQDYFAAAMRLRVVTPQITESAMWILIAYGKNAEAIHVLQQACAAEATATTNADSVALIFADIDCFVLGLDATASSESVQLLAQMAQARFAEAQRLLNEVHLRAKGPDSKLNAERILALGAREKALRPSPLYEEMLAHKTADAAPAAAPAAPTQMLPRHARAMPVQPDTFCGLHLSSSPAARAHNAALRAAELADPSSGASRLLHSLRALTATSLPSAAHEIEDAVASSIREGSGRASEVPWSLEALLAYLRCYACLPRTSGGAKTAGSIARMLLNLFPPTSAVFMRMMCVEMKHWDPAASVRAISGWRLKMQQGQGSSGSPLRFSTEELQELRAQAMRQLASSAPVLSRAQRQMLERIELWTKEDAGADATAAAKTTSKAAPTAVARSKKAAATAPAPSSSFNRSALMARFYALASGHAGASAAADALALAASVPVDAWDASLHCAYVACFVPSGSWRHCERICAVIQERQGSTHSWINATRNLIQCYYFAASNLQDTAAAVATADRISEAQMTAKVEPLWRKLQASPVALQQRHRRRSMLAASKGTGAADSADAASAAPTVSDSSAPALINSASSSSLSSRAPPPCPFSAADLSHLINTARKCFLDGEVARWGRVARQQEMSNKLSPIAQDAVRKVEQKEAAARAKQ